MSSTEIEINECSMGIDVSPMVEDREIMQLAITFPCYNLTSKINTKTKVWRTKKTVCSNLAFLAGFIVISVGFLRFL